MYRDFDLQLHAPLQVHRLQNDSPCAETADSLIAAWGQRLTIGVAIVWLAGFVVGFQLALTGLMIATLLFTTLHLTRPTFALLGVGMLCTLDTLSRTMVAQTGVLRYNTVNYFLLLVMVLYAPSILRMKGVQVRLLQAFVFVATLGVAYSPSTSVGVQNLLNFVSPWAILPLCTVVVSSRTTWLWLAIVNGTLAGLGGLIYYCQQDTLPRINNNEFARFPLTALFCICLSWLVVKHKYRPLLLALAAVNLSWVFLSGSRGNLLCGFCCLLFLLCEMKGFARRSLFVACATIAVGLIVMSFPTLVSRTQGKFEKLVDPSLSARQRTSGRSNLFVDGWAVFLDHPLGVGTGGFRDSRVNQAGVLWRRNEGVAAHSGWLKVLVEHGVPGTILFAMFTTSFALFGWLARSQGLLSLGVFTTVTLTLAFVSAEFAAKGLWLLAFGAVAFLNQEQSEHDIPPQISFVGMAD